ncbi:C6 transcription factor FacB [Trichophyton equinum CBS 127.97]|uniref:C6 transcription factor FacB n=1 Tax=Trichophyton equinum (strain ATCC MYA-4606 / CBS 127.97) TaxID=559882 RepID=F2Q5A5_TRIEC|nr:C6 transcription factor FacB [Trichophyton equinum CBS 127.97]
MPGILPMKVIKVGSNSQSRVAQACDRCRSKKIRCDGIRPSCSQCTNVGFECKTSDKLSRRAFPRGYTESLEDRVRSLEAEVRELKSLLDEKDERIDVLTRLQSFSLSSQKATSSPVSNISTSPAGYYPRPPQASRNEGEDLIYVQQSARSISKPADDTSFTGHSSTRSFIDSFSVRLERSGKSPTTALADALLCAPSLNARRHEDITPSNILPRLVSDRLLNIFFQEWAPLYPIVHRPEILKLYSRYTTNPDSIEADHHAFAQLNLIFGIAAISSTSRVPQDPLFFERHWIPKLKMLANDISLTTLQCYVLAQVYYSIKADYRSLLHYRGLGVSICLQLGLHHSQERFSLNPLVSETRKRVFWCQYTLDRFGAAFTGLPVLLAESDISTEYPADVDDENVTETGFVPTIPEESTRMSSALALFSASRILHRVLEDLYPSSAGYEISLSTVHSLAENLDEWLKNLPAHLQLTFLLDKPNASVASSRSILLVKKDNKKQMQPGYNPQVGMTEWDHALNDIDGGHGNIFPGIYSGGECGQAPGAFNTLPSNYPPSQQSTPALGMPVLHSSPDSMQGWPQESWTTAPRTAIPRSHPHTSHNGANPANGGTPAESPSAYNDGRGMDMRDQHMAQGHSNTHEGNNGHIHTCAPPLNPFEAMVMPHNLDSMQGTPNFNVSVTSGWGQHSVM